MPGLLDIAPSFRKVTIRGVEIDVPGVSALGVAYLISRFPIIRDALAGKAPEDAFTPEAIAALAPEALACVLAAGCGYVNNPDAEKMVASLGIEDQLSLIDAVIGETMPGGAAPFVAKLQATFKRNGIEFTNTPDTPSQPLSKE